MNESELVKFASFKYDYAQNLGDEIQSLAAEQFLPRVDLKIDRDTLGSFDSSVKYLVIMNGWFTYQPRHFFPPSKSILPVFFGFHMTEHNDAVAKFLNEENVAYFKAQEPIGCRDKRTMQLLAQKGVKGFYSKCLTLTFPKRDKDPREGKVFIVDADHVPVPGFIHDQAVFVTQDTYTFYDDEIKTLMAKKLLSTYKDQAKLIITTRLHCALPCIAMGIPVIFFGDPANTRTSLVKEVSVPIHRLPPNGLGRIYRISKHTWLGKIIRKIVPKVLYSNVDWNPNVQDIEDEKNRITVNIKSVFESKLGALLEEKSL